MFYTYTRITCHFGSDKPINQTTASKHTPVVHFSAFVDLATEISAILPLCRLKLSVYFHLGWYYRKDFSSPVFPIVFSINLIPFFDTSICSVLAVLSPGLFGCVLLYLGNCAVATVTVCGFGSWSLVFHCGMATEWHVKSPLFPNPLSNRSVLHDGRKHKTVVFSQPNAIRE